ncbi:MAG: amino acid adenylation domain-containing protein [Pyrinomonadaceae bacterium]
MSEEVFEGFRLSPQQEHIWLLQQAGLRHAFRCRCVVGVEGMLDTEKLRAALRALVQRHEILRTTFRRLPGMAVPVQVIGGEDAEPSLRVHDLGGLDTDAREARTRELLKEARQRPFDDERGPLVEFDLLRHGHTRHALVVTASALCTDAPSLLNIVREIARLYAAGTDAADSSDAPAQYADMAEWQNEILEGTEGEVGREHWRALDLSAAVGLKLSFEKQHANTGAAREENGARPHSDARTVFEPHALGREVNPRVAEALRAQACELPSLLLACWTALLWRLTGQAEVVVGLLSSDRKYPELREALGPFAKSLPVRAFIEEGKALGALAGEVAEETRAAVGLQEYFSWEQLDGAASAPPCAYGFSYDERATETRAAVNGVNFAVEDVYACVEQFKAALGCTETGGVLLTEMLYDGAALSAEDAARLLDEYHALLESVSVNPRAAIGELRFVGEMERRQLLFELNETQRDFGEALCIHELFARQAASTPAATAVVYEGESLTYAELDARANQLAQRLRRLGVGPEVVVGLLLERSIEMLVALLGVFKAGGAYLPLDPLYPRERLAFMLEDAGVEVLVRQEHLLADLADGRARVVTLARGGADLAAESTQAPAGAARPENLAYVIYTSGSTGAPKGVMISHRAIVNRLLWMQATFPLEAGTDRVLQKTPFSFDASVWEFFVPLLSGAQVVMARPGGHQESAYLARVICEQGVTVLQLVPSMLQVFLEEPGVERCTSLRRVFCGGELLPAKLRDTLFARLGGVELTNLYGPTEASIDSTFWPCSRTDAPGVVPIGYPLSNMKVYLLDSHLQPVPLGAPGDLYVSGTGLARGYLGRAELTAERFIPNPFADEPGARLYQTGDVARRMPGGAVEFLGRADQQVKIRGFRIELGEIEAALARHTAVREAVVVVRADATGETRLVAYWTPADAAQMRLNGELRTFLRESLPDYMLPSAFVQLEAMPLTPNGKLDRRSLPAPEQTRAASERPYVAPRTPVEERLAGIWSELLKAERVGAHDDFFDLGGHSLLATRLVSRVHEAFGVAVPLRSLFEGPTVAQLARSIAAGSEAGGSSEAAAPLIPVVERDSRLPLSFAQQRLWFLDQLEGDSAAYNMAAAVRLRGTLDAHALEQSLDEIVRRHEILRTAFVAEDGRPAQVIAPFVKLEVPITDLRALAANERETEVQDAAVRASRTPFDLTRAPLLRASLLHTNEDEHVLLLTLHHIVSDGWSMGVLIRELSTLYAHYTSGQPSPLAELPVQYADFAAWQREWLQGEVLEEQLAYWKQQLRDAPELLELPTDRPRPAVQSFVGASHALTLPRELTEALKEVGRREGATLFMTLLAVFQTLLHRYTGQADIIVGSPVAGRHHAQTENLIGLFINTLVLRTDLSGNPPFRELLARVRETALGATEHQSVPFERLVEELQPRRDLSHTPLFQVMFIFQNAEAASAELPGLSFSSIEVESGTAKFDLTLALGESEEGLNGALEYNSDLFDPATVARMAEHFRTLVEEVAARPDERLARLPMLGADERLQILRGWNETRADYPKDACLQQLFEAQAARTPDAPAARFEDGAWLSYAELNERAERLAGRLRALGVGAESRVGVCLERSVGMVVALLGVLKAGGAYVPLDPAYPRERLAFMLEDAGLSVLLTAESLAETLPAHGAHVVRLDADGLAHDGNDETANGTSPRGVASDNAAYIIYTSGSTGKPKGVVITHRAVVNFLLSMAARPGLDASDVLLAVTSLSFDIAALELFLPLVVGARLVLVGRETAADGGALLEHLRRDGVTAMQATPSTWGLLAQAGWQSDGSLKILCGGEALPPELAARLLGDDEEQHLWNLYGPTETTIWSAVGRVRGGAEEITIGRPIRNTQIYLLDADFNPVTVGVAGELYIGGDGLARGYFGRPELTAERFVPDPFAPELGARLYRTGDLARYRADGRAEFLGRVDQQVKVRGFRIELGEIEAALARHPSIERAVAVAREGTTAGEKSLAVYFVVGAGAGATDARELREFLRRSLPEYMMPSAFVRLESLPLTPNGKVDRRALPAPSAALSAGGEGFRAPRTPVEEVLAGVWAEVLGLERVGAEENFFDLGGHSLLATQLISRVRRLLRVELPMRVLFEAPTVAGLAAAVERQRRAGAEETPIRPVGRDADLPLSFAQQRLWFLDQFDPNSATFNLPSAVRLTGRLDVPALEEALRQVIARHEILRTSFLTQRGRGVQRVAPVGAALSVPVVDLSELPEARRAHAVRELMANEATRPFPLDAGALLRVLLLRTGSEEHVALLTMHHIVSDGWSLGVLVHEVAELYAARVSGRPASLPELVVQYADFAAWQREHLQGDVLEEEIAYWRAQLGGAPPVLELPFDRPRPARMTFRGAMHPVRLPKELADELNALSRREGVTLFMTLLAAFQALLRHYARRDDIVVGTDVANRNRVETENLIGFFVNQLVLRTDLSGNPTYRELLGRVREVTLGAYAHQDLPFEQLVDALRPERSLRHAPLFQVKLVLQNNPIGSYELPGLTISPVTVESVAAKFDLTLLMGEEPDGLNGHFEYNADLFEAATVARFGESFEALLRAVVARPGARLDELAATLAGREREEHDMETTRRGASGLRRLKEIKPKVVSVQQEELVRTELLRDGPTLPLVIRPALKDVDLRGWATSSLPFIESRLLEHGALLFRGFGVETSEPFESFASVICPDLFNENGEHPRQSVGGKVYTPVFYPPDQQLLWHNENSFNHQWPGKIFFGCVQPARAGGETPVVDSRKVYEVIDPRVRERFDEKGVMYVRNYSRDLGLDWETVFQTSDRAEVEAKCRRNRMTCEWKAGNLLRTRCVRPATVRHPQTGEWTWFNQAQHWHISCLDPATRESVVALFAEEDFPRNCYYGDGSRIADEEMRAVLDTYARLEVVFPWERGDVLVLDNLLTAHGRNRFSGERKLMVAMGGMLSYEEV